MAIDVDDDPELEPWRCWDGEVGEPWPAILGPEAINDIVIIPALTVPGLVPLAGLTKGPPPPVFGPPPKKDERDADEEWGDAPGWCTIPAPDPTSWEGDGRSISFRKMRIDFRVLS